jgi:hypothetical protein
MKRQVAVISHAGVGDFLHHMNSVRLYREFFADFDVTVFAAAERIELGPLIINGVSWAPRPTDPSALRSFDAVATLRWFASLHPQNGTLADYIWDMREYALFDRARPQEALGLREFFEHGDHFGDILTRSFGLPPDGCFLPDNRLAEIGRNQFCPSEPYIVMCNDADTGATTKRQTKQVPAGLWAAIVRGTMRHGLTVVEVGRRRDPCTELDGYRDLRGLTSAMEWVGLLAHAAGIVTIEGGNAHVAAALGKAAVVLCGPTSRQWYGHAGHRYISGNVCSPCAWKTIDWFENCPEEIGAACMYALDEEKIQIEFAATLAVEVVDARQ